MTSTSPHQHEHSPHSPTANNTTSAGRKLSLRGSPRSSIDSVAEKTTTSPFLHNLQQRFRKTSNASSHSQENSTNNPPLSAQQLQEQQQQSLAKEAIAAEHKSRTEATRAAKRYLLSVVRDDWQYPPPPGSERNQQNPAIPHREPITYVKREDGSDYEDYKQQHQQYQHQQQQRRRAGSDGGKRGGSSSTGAAGSAGGEGKQGTGQEWKYESPESFTRFAAERAHKKRRLMEEECKWNEGLKVWVGRRDEWTDAVKHKPKVQKARKSGEMGSGSGDERRNRASRERKRSSGLRNVLMERNGSESTTTDSTATGTTTDETGSIGQLLEKAPSPSSPTPEQSSSPAREASATSADHTEAATRAGDADDDDGPYLPIFPPLFEEDNILREKINPAAYNTIYSKVVVQVLAPNIPIPLTHMTRALVEGWKHEGQWPPPASQPLPQDAKVGKKSSKFGRWRRQKMGASNAGDGGVKDKAVGIVKGIWGGRNDGGLRDIGIEFEEPDTEELEGNMELNKSLLQEKGRL